jgi:hypothetical protein
MTHSASRDAFPAPLAGYLAHAFPRKAVLRGELPQGQPSSALATQLTYLLHGELGVPVATRAGFHETWSMRTIAETTTHGLRARARRAEAARAKAERP